MRIESLSRNNRQTQGARQREILRRQSPQHLANARELMLQAMHQRPAGVSRGTLVLGAGTCTEIPLAALVRHSDEVVLADLDGAAMQQARAELPSAAARKAVSLVVEDLSGGLSAHLWRLLDRQPWDTLAEQGARTLFDAAAACLDACPVPDPPRIAGLIPGNFGVVISSLVLTQLFSYPLLDVLDRVQRVAPAALAEQERHHRYQAAAQSFRERVIAAHLHLMQAMLERDGLAVLLCDQRGFVFSAPNAGSISNADPAAMPRRTIPLVPHAFFDLLEEQFRIVEKHEWEWLSDLPAGERHGRGYEVGGYLLAANDRDVAVARPPEFR